VSGLPDFSPPLGTFAAVVVPSLGGLQEDIPMQSQASRNIPLFMAAAAIAFLMAPPPLSRGVPVRAPEHR